MSTTPFNAFAGQPSQHFHHAHLHMSDVFNSVSSIHLKHGFLVEPLMDEQPRTALCDPPPEDKIVFRFTEGRTMLSFACSVLEVRLEQSLSGPFDCQGLFDELSDSFGLRLETCRHLAACDFYPGAQVLTYAVTRFPGDVFV
ncbi:MAG: hypothetical protein AAGA67_03995 [Cyanobacteria bacterium P01_F01_bin.153]